MLSLAVDDDAEDSNQRSIAFWVSIAIATKRRYSMSKWETFYFFVLKSANSIE